MFRKDAGAATRPSESFTRHSRGWADLLAYLKSTESLRVLDFGATSPANINYLTALGHSVYMTNLVQDAAREDWQRALDGGSGATEFDVERFIAANLEFSGREFDIVLLWDTANYLPPAAVPALFHRLRDVLRPQGRLLAFFHGRDTGPGTACCRYQLTDSDSLLLLPSGDFPVTQVYQTRQVEQFLEGFNSVRFFLGKDNVREVIAIR